MEGNIKICPNCGAEYVIGGKCQYCGQLLPSTPSSCEKQQTEQSKLASTVKIYSGGTFLPLEIRFDGLDMVVHHAPTISLSHKDLKVDLYIVCDGKAKKLFLMNSLKDEQHYSRFYINRQTIEEICEAKEILLRFDMFPARDFILSTKEIDQLKHEAQLLYHCVFDDTKYTEVLQEAKEKYENKKKTKEINEQNKLQSMRQSILDNVSDNKAREIHQFPNIKYIVYLIIALGFILLVFFILLR